MNRITLFALTLSGVYGDCTAVLAAPPTERESRDACSYAMPSMVFCLANKAKTSDVELRRAEQSVRTALPKVDDWASMVTLAKRSFARSRREFLRYRAAQCDFNATLVGGAAGNAHEVMRQACVTELNTQRTELMRGAVRQIAFKNRH
jgi:uncharacterized protein YecT (DUF1311 family)